MRTLILCLGNERVSDDGIGAEIGRVLRLLPLPDDILVKVVPRLRLDLLDVIAGIDHLVIVDALAAKAAPGTCTVVDVTQHCAAVVASGCCHSNDVRDLIHLAREVAPRGSECSITIAGVQADHVDRYDAPYSQAVLLARPRLVDLVLLSTGAELKIRLLAEASFRETVHLLHDVSAPCDWQETSAQAAGVQ
jgi:hydrogenase maturation protease